MEKIQQRDDAKKKFLSTLGVNEVTNPAGKYGYREIKISNRELPITKEDIGGLEIQTISRDASLAVFNANDFLFFDTETTGLAGGTGTTPFLIGIGFFDEDGFRVCQYMMRDYDEEAAVLHDLVKQIGRFPALASYNGKCFDAPILQARFLLNRLRFPITDMPHLDLLFAARRFWKKMLPSCSLSTVESRILGRTREEDISGELIPYVYFDFLRGIRIERMRPVLFHNVEDVVSLAMLAAKICRMVRHPENECRHGWEWFGLGCCLAAAGMWERTFFCLEQAVLEPSLSLEEWIAINKFLSLSYKRLARMKEAVDVWQRMIERGEDVFAMIELAKFHEHTEKKYAEALALTERAILQMRNRQNDVMANGPATVMYEELLHRWNRLLEKRKNP